MDGMVITMIGGVEISPIMFVRYRAIVILDWANELQSKWFNWTNHRLKVGPLLLLLLLLFLWTSIGKGRWLQVLLAAKPRKRISDVCREETVIAMTMSLDCSGFHFCCFDCGGWLSSYRTTLSLSLSLPLDYCYGHARASCLMDEPMN